MHYQTFEAATPYKETAFMGKRNFNVVARGQMVRAAAMATFLAASPISVNAEAIGTITDEQRAQQAYQLRIDAAVRNYGELLPEHPNNGDDLLYSNKINSYTKGLPHDENGIVDPVAYQELLTALSTGNPSDFENITMGEGGFLLRNPQAAYTFFMEGKDAHSYTMPAAPAFDSAWQASDAIEVMWQALTRDVPFSEYANNALIKEAAKDLSKMSDFRGPMDKNKVTPQTLFRGVGVGETVGPYISQFLLKDIPYGATTVVQKYNVPVAGNDHLTNYAEWLLIQRGGRPSGITTVQFQPERHYIYNGRAMAQYVLQDFVNQAYLGATRIIRGFGSGAYDKNDPYANSASQARSPLFGNNHAVDWIGRIAMGSQNVAWYQKWLVHRRARPEVFFGRVHNHLTKDNINYPLHKDLLKSAALAKVFEEYGTYLLPTATPDGSPLHPTYPAGHSVMAGAAVTMLKAFFNGDFEIPNPVMPNADGTALLPYVGDKLTIEGELNKLASNIALGRDVAGVHFRTDGDLGLVLGEEYAISILRELIDTYNEDFAGLSFNRFDGTPVTIQKLH